MILIIINFLLITSLLYLRKKDIKVAIIQSYLLTTGITLVFTEILSTFNLVTFSGLLISWSTLAVLLIFWRIRKYGSQKVFNLKEIVGHISTRRSDFAPEILMIFGIVLILVITLVIALFAPPNNGDSMTYHMARIVHWIQQRNVDFFTTSISRQNHSMPLAEYMILNLQLLSKSDRYANLVQWSAFVVLVLSVTQVANFLGVSKRGQLVSGFFMATIPMAILQSTSTQNDIVVSLFCLLFVYFLLRLIKYGSWLAVFYAGLSLGLALLTKGTAYIFCAATGITLGITGLILKIRERKIRLVLNLIAVILLALTLNSGYYQRNINLYSHPLSTETDRVTIDEFSLAGFYSNLIRNGSMHLAVPFPPANRLLTQVIEFLLQGQINSSATTFPGSEFEIQYLINEDESGNFLHFVLLITSLFFISRKRTTKDDYIPFYFFSVTASILLFSALLK
ncbi:MAG: glycosyltransferase family 39 protein, partial [Candidatus Heimdallarchaeota archaeon]